MRKYFRDESGVGAIEFSIIAPFLAIVLLGTISGWAYYSQNNYMRDAVEVAGKYFLQLEPNGDIYPCVLQIGSFQPKNAFRDGVEAAWRHASSHSCFDCYNTWLNENRATDVPRGTMVNGAPVQGRDHGWPHSDQLRTVERYTRTGHNTLDVSLTITEIDGKGFSVSLIPETLERTTLRAISEGDPVNLEVDMLAKYAVKAQ